MVWYDIVLKLQYACFIVVLKRHGIGQVHRRRSAQRMRSETSNTAIDLCPGAAFYNDTLSAPQSDQFHVEFYVDTACS